MNKNTFMVFEGGGAKGISHIGTLKAVENRPELKIVGAAGTSAGSIIAALVAAGFNSDEMLSPDEGRDDGTYKSLFDLIGDGCNRPSELWETQHWLRIKALRWLLNTEKNRFWLWLGRFFLIFVFISVFWPVISLIDLSGLMPFGSGSFAQFLSKALWFTSIVFHIVLFALLFWILYSFSGLASMNKFEATLEELLQNRITPSNGCVTFGDIKSQGFILKIVVSEISTGKMKLFSSESDACAHISVAKAVSASCAVPFVFRPVTIEGRQYSDGGMVSNLPAWSLDEHIILDEDSWIITSESIPASRAPGSIRIDSDGMNRPIKGSRVIAAVAKTALFGASDLNTRGLSHHVRIPVPLEIGLLDFDIPARKAYTTVLASSLFADEILEARFEEIDFLEAIHQDATALIAKVTGKEEVNLRSALVRRINLSGDETAGYHLWCCEGYEEYPDRNLKLSKSGTLIDSCLNGEPSGAFADLTTPSGEHRFYMPDKSGLLKVLTPSCRQWALAIPLKGRKLVRISVAITFDCDVPLGDHFNDVRKGLVKLCQNWEK